MTADLVASLPLATKLFAIAARSLSRRPHELRLDQITRAIIVRPLGREMGINEVQGMVHLSNLNA